MEDLSDSDQLAKLCKNSRSLSSALSEDDNHTSKLNEEFVSHSALTDSMTAFNKSENTNNVLSKNSTNEHILELAKKAQEGMGKIADAFRDEHNFEVAKKAQEDIINVAGAFRDEVSVNASPVEDKGAEKCNGSTKSSDRSSSRKSSGRKICIEQNDDVPKSCLQSRRSSTVSSKSRRSASSDKMLEDAEDPVTNLHINSEVSYNRKVLDYHNFLQEMENNSRAMDTHIEEFSVSRFESGHLEKELQALDQMTEFASRKPPIEKLEEMNNNFKMMSVIETKPVPRKRSLSKNPTVSNNTFGDASMSNQDLLNDLLRK